MDIYNTRKQIKLNQCTIFDLQLRVVYYARVSTEKEEQKTSIDHQQDYFEEFITGVERWTYVGKYIDEGFSGINTSKREAFQKMIADAKQGKFDLILTKEITRFARNVVDSISYTRNLLECGTAVWFQNDNINTLDEDSELRLTIMSGIAQDESRKLSSRVRFGHARSIQNGVVLGNSHIYGWDKRDGRLYINEKEAEMVRIIYQKYASGCWSTHSLEKFLWECGYRNYKGGRISSRVIGNIIRNPKYKGFYVGGKVKIIDIFSKKQKFLPEQEWTMYPDDGSRVPAIVSEELWEEANRVFTKRSNNVKEKNTSCKPDNLFTGLIRCGNDGATYWLKARNIHGKESKTWVCSSKIKNGAGTCNSFPVKEEDLLKIVSDSFNEMSGNKQTFLDKYLAMYEKEVYSLTCTDQKTESLKQDIEILEARRDKLLDFNLTGLISDKEFLSRNRSFSSEIEEKKRELSLLEKNIPMSKEELLKNIENLAASIREYAQINPEDLTPEILESTISSITIHPRSLKQAEVVISFHNGCPRKKTAYVGSSETTLPSTDAERTLEGKNGVTYFIKTEICV